MDITNKKNDFTFKQGITAGLIMTLILLFFQFSGQDYSPMAKLSKYIVLGLIISYTLYKLIGNQKGRVFMKGILAGNKVTLVAASTLLIVNLLIYLITPEYAFSKYNLIPNTIIQSFVIGIILFFETFVFGNIITFISMQYFKNQSRS